MVKYAHVKYREQNLTFFEVMEKYWSNPDAIKSTPDPIVSKLADFLVQSYDYKHKLQLKTLKNEGMEEMVKMVEKWWEALSHNGYDTTPKAFISFLGRYKISKDM